MEYSEYVILRDKHGYCDSDVAKGTGIDKSTFSNWKGGKSKPKVDKINKILDFLGETRQGGTITFNLKAMSDALHSRFDNEYGSGIIDAESQIYLRNELLHHMLLAGGRIVEEHPEVIEAMIYTLEKMGEKK